MMQNKQDRISKGQFDFPSAGCIFKNPYLDLGLVPKGGSAFFLSRLMGHKAACQVLLDREDISASKASELGLVNDVVPFDTLKQTALGTAKAYAELPSGSLAGIKKLMNFSIKELECCLEKENELMYRLTDNPNFREKILTSVANRP